MLEFDDAYECSCIVKLCSGREIALERLTQSRTYAGHLEGVPNPKWNDMLIADALERATQMCGRLGPAILIAPKRNASEPTGDIDVRYVEEWLPQIECIGEFHSISPARDMAKDASSLTIVWYQCEFGIESASIDEIRKVEWERFASDWEY